MLLVDYINNSLVKRIGKEQVQIAISVGTQNIWNVSQETKENQLTQRHTLYIQSQKKLLKYTNKIKQTNNNDLIYRLIMKACIEKLKYL